MLRRATVKAAIVVGAAGLLAAAGVTSADGVPGGPWPDPRPQPAPMPAPLPPQHRAPTTNGFAADGVWNRPLPATVPLAANSAALVATIVKDKHDYYDGWALNTDEYSTPIYTVGRDTPRQRWTYSDCLGVHMDADIAASLAAVPTPPDLTPSKGTDAAVTIYQPSTDTYWDFWRAEKDADGHWSACWGGKLDHYSRNPGIFPKPLGATATGLPLGAFTIRIAELQRGHIDHALNVALPRTRKDCISWPASRTDGEVEGEDIPCEGQRFRLDPSVDVSVLPSPAGQVIAKAMQEYGLIVTDKAGAVVTYAEDPRPVMATNGGIDPYAKLIDPTDIVPDGQEKYVVLTGLPVERLQALPLDWGKPCHRGPFPR